MKIIHKLITELVIVSLMLVHLPLTAVAAEDESDSAVQVVHSPLEKTKAGELITVSAEIDGKEGIELVRIYFRSVESKAYYFVPMTVTQDATFTGLLPAPTDSLGSMEYLFLVKTYNNRIFISQSFPLTISGQVKAGAGEESSGIDVLTEVSEAPPVLPGFDDKTRIRTVTKSEKHGVVAGLYEPEDTEGTTSNGQYHGMVVATEKSYLNAILIGGGVVAGVVVVGALIGSSSSDGGGSSTPDDPADPGTVSTGAGNWTLVYENGACSKTTEQTVECSSEGLVTAVSPTAIGIPLPDACDNTPYSGLAGIFVVGGSCDSITACSNYSPADLDSKTCSDSSMTIIKDGGTRIENWSK